ncbi:MAG: LPS export ABC transporter periplasmic protein LptC [Prevotellaceae bacterium]|nr:LPS export ABC transporter periplasmic protein LptC [Prevotellaceae bacterium]
MKKSNFTYIILIIAVLSVALACRKEQKEIIGAVEDRALTPRMHSDSVITVVSDSGVTRYRISAPVWDVFDFVDEPYWNFPEGIRFERFDRELKVDANIHANYAKYETTKQLWELKGKVRATNIEGDIFVTEQMFWNERTAKIYSDSLITITKTDGAKLVGQNGFESNQQLTKYIIKNNIGNIPYNSD